MNHHKARLLKKGDKVKALDKIEGSGLNNFVPQGLIGTVESVTDGGRGIWVMFPRKAHGRWHVSCREVECLSQTE